MNTNRVNIEQPQEEETTELFHGSCEPIMKFGHSLYRINL